MTTNHYIKLIIMFSYIFHLSCNAEIEVPGCTNSNACNYESIATADDGSCYYKTTLICYNDTQGDSLHTSCDFSCSDLIGNWLIAPQVSLSASPSSISVGEFITLSVNVANIENLFGISLQILFDSSSLEVIMESVDLDWDVFTDYNFGPVAKSDEGIVSLVLSLGGNNINGNIFPITFKGLQSGAANVVLNEVNLIQDDGSKVSNYNSIRFMDVNITISE